MRIRKALMLAGTAALALSALAATACGDGEDRPGVTVIGDDDSSGTGSGTGVGAEPGVVEDPPEGATEVDVTIGEWSVAPDTTTVSAGEIYFLVDNVGPEDPHEFVIVKSDEAPGDLPTVDGKVPEDEIDLVDEIEPFLPDSSASIAVELEPGNYILLCNIVEIEEGEVESHYELGMYTGFTVE